MLEDRPANEDPGQVGRSACDVRAQAERERRVFPVPRAFREEAAAEAEAGGEEEEVGADGRLPEEVAVERPRTGLGEEGEDEDGDAVERPGVVEQEVFPFLRIKEKVRHRKERREEERERDVGREVPPDEKGGYGDAGLSRMDGIRGSEGEGVDQNIHPERQQSGEGDGEHVREKEPRSAAAKSALQHEEGVDRDEGENEAGLYEEIQRQEEQKHAHPLSIPGIEQLMVRDPEEEQGERHQKDGRRVVPDVRRDLS